MNAKWILITLVAVIGVSVGLTGCEKKKNVTDTTTVEKTVDTPAPTEDPAAAKPKDHPAH